MERLGRNNYSDTKEGQIKWLQDMILCYKHEAERLGLEEICVTRQCSDSEGKTDCGVIFKPQNNVKYCPYCGKKFILK